MKAQRIFWTVIFMAIAMLGLIAIQVYWISFSVNLSEKKLQQNIDQCIADIVYSLDHAVQESAGRSLSAEDSISFSQSMLEQEDVRRLLGIDDMTTILSAQTYDEVIRREVEKNRISLDYNYLIYSSSKESPVIANGYNLYVQEEEEKASPGISLDEREDPLENYGFEADLFKTAYGSQGKLFLSFEGYKFELWKDVWLILLGSVLLLSGVIYAFWYTLRSFFRQRKLSEMKNDFINNMTHEFKTPIATVSLAVDSIESPTVIKDVEKVRKFTRVIKQEMRRMLGQVEKVLHAALLERGDYTLNPELIDMHELTETAVMNISLMVEKRKGEISFSRDAEDYFVHVDKTHTANVIHNLLENAIKYSPETPEIKVRSFNENGYFCLSIADKGVGIEKEVKDLVFEKFFREHTGNRHDVKGFGLGLTYVKSIMDAQEGKVTVESKKGEGSCFSLCFKLNEES